MKKLMTTVLVLIPNGDGFEDIGGRTSRGRTGCGLARS